jgi:catechol 2,3-dioxygenase-like lactoylglutathione lyase family enzyme
MDMEPQDQIAVVLKEYEGLRKEIDARTDATRMYGWPVIILVVGAMASWKTEFARVFDIALLFMPAVGMTIAALGANANYAIDKTRVALARIEERVFDISGQVLLDHESRAIARWHRYAWRWFSAAIVASVLYVWAEWWLFTEIPEESWGSKETDANVITMRKSLVVAILGAPVAIYLYNAVKMFRLRKEDHKNRLKRMDNVGIMVKDLDAAISFFAELGLKLQGRATIEGEWAGRVTGLGTQRVEIAMMCTLDGHTRLELSRFLSPTVVAVHRNAPVNALGYLRVMFTVEDIDDTLVRLHKRGAELVGEVVQYQDTYRLCYIRGPEGILIGLVQEFGRQGTQ